MPKKVERIEFPNNGVPIVADLYRPAGRKPHPCVVMANGFGLPRLAALPALAERFRAAGLGVLLFDYRHLGDSGGEPRQLVDAGRQIDDWHRAIAAARSTEWIDRERVGLWGYSLGGGHTIRVAAEDGRVKAVVGHCPMSHGLGSVISAHKVGLAKALVAGLRDQASAIRGGEPIRILSAAPTGEAGALTAPGHYEAYTRLLEGLDYPNEACARFALTLGLVNNTIYARDVICPTLVCIADRDDVTPPGPQAKLARALPKGEARHYDSDHFDLFYGQLFEQVVSDQSEFLTEHLA